MVVLGGGLFLMSEVPLYQHLAGCGFGMGVWTWRTLRDLIAKQSFAQVARPRARDTTGHEPRGRASTGVWVEGTGRGSQMTSPSESRERFVSGT